MRHLTKWFIIAFAGSFVYSQKKQKKKALKNKIVQNNEVQNKIDKRM